LDLRVGQPPEKPLLIFDGDCNFCRIWVNRWRHTTADYVDYLPFQDPAIANRFPELPRKGFETAVHLVEPDGSVFNGAEAAFRALDHSPHESILLGWYLRHPWFARTAEALYRFVAAHRPFFSKLTLLAWGPHVEPSSYQLVRWCFLKSLGLIYLIAFLSLSVQIMGLIGSSGILPANATMFGLRQEANAGHVGLSRYFAIPTLCWFSASDGFLKFQCAAGIGLSVLLIFGIAPAPCLFLLWLVYLSLSVVFREFLNFQWDTLLLETGLLAIFFAPLQLLPRRANVPPPSRLVLWLLRWLLFRLMFGSGLVKLMSGDPTWRNLTALQFHYETQPLPTWVGWYAHQLPGPFQQFSTLLMFLVELVLPFLIFTPRRLRRVPFIAFVALQILIFLTGNYCFFNLLTMALCLALLDDNAVRKLLPKRLLNTLTFSAHPAPQAAAVDTNGPAHEPGSKTPSSLQLSPGRRWPIKFTFPLTCIAILVPLMQFATVVRPGISFPREMIRAYTWVSPLRSFNHYGLFQVMTTNRMEIILEGSVDGITWSEYEFKYKPGNVKREPGFVAPHQPRLDWQMWFAALSDYRYNPWLVELCIRLLNGSPKVVDLLQSNPFPRAPPKYIRAILYEYKFTDAATRRKTGAWWRRVPKGLYLPVLSQKSAVK
jgi:predicted DCC family thiol-disulfide oxidoreductase YuxK